MKINIDNIEKVTVEIGEFEYTVAEKTADLCEKINKIIDDANKTNKGIISVENMIKTIEILIGKNAVKEVLPKGKNDNYDKIMVIYYGVLDCFNYNTDKIKREREEKLLQPSLDRLNEVAEKVGPLSNLNRAQLRSLK